MQHFSILQCAFTWKGHWKSCYSVQFSKPFYWKHWSDTACTCIYLITFYRILQNGNYPPQRAFTFASNSIERSRMCAFLMTAENRETSYLSMKTQNKHKINVVYLDTVLELWSLIIIQPDAHFHFVCTSTSEVDLNAVFFLFCKDFFLQEQQKEALVCMGIRIQTLCLPCRRRKERFSNRHCS